MICVFVPEKNYVKMKKNFEINTILLNTYLLVTGNLKRSFKKVL